jgi:hypothetical protein
MVMTDPGLTGVLDGDESPTNTAEDLLSAHEVVPKHLKTEPELDRVPCPYCDKDFRGGRWGKGPLASHVKYKHKDRPQIGKTPPAKGKPKLPKSAAVAKAVPEPKAKARKPAGENLSLLVSGGAQFAAKSGYVPLANALMFEAPAAGQVIDLAIADTWSDKHLVQPLMGGVEKWEAVGACLGLPLKVHLISIYPGLQAAFEPSMRRDAEEILILSVPTIRKKVERDRKVVDALAELGHLDPAIAADPDPIGSIIAGFYGPTEAPSDN